MKTTLTAQILHVTFLVTVSPILAPAAESPPENLRVAFFYNSAIFSDDTLRSNVLHLLNDDTDIETFTIGYKNAADFRQRYFELMQTGRCDLILGPTESAALKALNDSLTNRQSVPFLAPYITTATHEYPNLNVTAASPSDSDRVKTAVDDFVDYTDPRIIAIVHTDDLWGRSMVDQFRGRLRSPKTIVHAQPVEEFKGADLNRTNDHMAFIQKMHEHGATVIGIALLTEEAANRFLNDLAKFNMPRWVPYKPTILLLSQPRFDDDNQQDGILFKHAKEFNIFYVENCLKGSAVKDSQQAALAPYLDACNIIARAARTWSNTVSAAGAEPLVVQQIFKFYRKEWPSELREATFRDMITGFHSEHLGYTNQVMAVTRAVLKGGTLQNRPVASYFERGPIARVYHSAIFFLKHHRSLWNPWTLSLFVGAALMSFFHVIHLKSEKPPWMLLRMRPFWSLFVLNLLVTYIVWVLSIHFGIFADGNLGAALALAAACPTAGSAFSDVVRRYLPMIDLTGIIRILERLNEEMLNHVGKERLDALMSRLLQLNPERIKSAFLDVLLLQLGSGDLRNRIREQLRKKLEDAHAELDRMKEDLTPEKIDAERERLERQIYAGTLLNALGYMCSSGSELAAKVDELLAREHFAAVTI